MSDPIKSFTLYSPTKLAFGAGVTNDAGAQIAALGIRSVLLVSGPGATRKSAGYAALEAGLAAAGVAHTSFDRVPPDPSAEAVAEAAEAVRAGGHEALVAYGGGSPIDCSKSAALSVANGVPMLDLVYGRAKASKPALPIIAVPSTAGTGSEMSSATVTTDLAAGRKMGFSSESIYPRLAIVDPANHVSMPRGITAATGLDALTHVVESYLSLNSNPYCDLIDLRAVSLIGANLADACDDGSNLAARSAMAFASSTAGIAFSQTGLGMVHGFAHPVGAKFGVAHGTANAIILPYVMAALAADCAPRMRDLGAAIGACAADAEPTRGAKAFVDAIVALKARLGVAASLAEAGVGPKDAPAVLADALTYRMRPRSPRAFTDAELARLLDAAIAGDIKAAWAI